MTEHTHRESPHDLPPEENERIFVTKILPQLYRNIKGVAHPEAHFFGAQPGAGKSSVEGLIQDQLDEADGPLTTMEIIGDEFRQFHPDYDKLKALDDQAMATHTATDSGRWVEKAITYSQDLRSHVILEGTLRRAEVTIGSAEGYRSAEFKPIMHVLAVHEFTSRERIIGRYFGQLAKLGHGRYTQRADHDRSYRQLPDSLRQIADSGQFETIHLYNERGIHLAEAGTDGNAEPLLAMLNQIRNTPPDPEPLLARLEVFEQQAIDHRKLETLEDIRQLRRDVLEARSRQQTLEASDSGLLPYAENSQSGKINSINES